MRRARIVTLLFTDLVGSSNILDELGDDAADELRRIHFSLLRETVSRFRGREVKSLGDGLMVVFPSALDAISCSIRMQQAVAAHNEEQPESELHVRIGLHAGEPITEENDYFGRSVVVAKRLCDRAEGGQILASELVRDIVGSRGGFAFQDLGPMELKGLAQPTRTSAIVWDPTTPVTEQEDDEDEWPAPPVRIVSRKSMWLAVAVALVAIAGMATAVAFLVKDDPQDDGSSTAGPTWTRTDDVDLRGDGAQRINHLVQLPNKLVAVGYEEVDGDQDAAVWTSSDGSEWTRAEESHLAKQGRQIMWGATTTESGIVVVGTDHSDGTARPAAWLSTDGDSWERAAVRSARSSSAVMKRVIESNDGLVAVGYEADGADWDAAVWTSGDGGATWGRVPHDESVFGGTGKQEMRSVATTGGTLVAVGATEGRAEDFEAAAWYSRDGATWEAVRHDKRTFGGTHYQAMTAVTADVERGFVAVGTDGRLDNQDAGAWTSEFGDLWSRAPLEEEELGGKRPQEMHAVTKAGDVFLAAGKDAIDGTADAALWSSSDGLHWMHLEGDETGLGGDGIQEMRSLLVFGDDLVVGVGWTGSDANSDAEVWTARLDSLI